jgi:protein phosphatase
VPFDIHMAGLSDVGRVRRRNEDSLALDPSLGIVLVADGMGGYPGGDLASRAAADHVLERLRAERSPAPGDRPAEDWVGVMSAAVVGAHEAVRALAVGDAELAGMGTTLTALALVTERETWVVGHVGDSRAYLLRHGSFRQLTRDDTWVQQKIDEDLLTPTQARRHPFSHILTQCLGLDPTPAPQVLSGRIQQGDLFLLCSDGLVGMLDEEIIADALRAHVRGPGTPAEVEGAVRTLVAEALARGGTDNVTVALAAVS